MDVPQTVSTALADRPVEGAVCLEAGAGVGNTTAGLLEAGAAHVYAVTNDRDHARLVRDRLDATARARATVLHADLRDIPLSSGSIDLVTAHGLFNLLVPDAVAAVLAEFGRVANEECHLVVDDYEPLPEDAAMRDLFALENAAAELADGAPALTFYPADVLRSLCVGYGWTFDRETTLLDPVPWTTSHVEAHAAVVRELADQLAGDSCVPDALVAEADRLVDTIGSESAGVMYSLAFHRAGAE